ncbi:MAG: hypothetical protein ACMXYC_00955 [Candidatus Woesearchaeota archaeon]
MNIIERGVYTLYDLGVAHIILPFFFVFVVCFAILQKINFLAKDPKDKKIAKKPNLIISVVIAFSVIVYHVMNTGGPYDIVPVINAGLPSIAVLLVAGLALLLIVGLVVGKRINIQQQGSVYLFALALLTVVYIYIDVTGQMPTTLTQLLNNPMLIGTVVTLVVFFVVISFVTSDPKKPKKTWKDVNKKIEEYIYDKK